MKKLLSKCAFLTIMLALIYSTAFASPIVIFDDDYGSGWSRGTWDVYIDNDNTYNSSAASLQRVGGVSIASTQPGGLDVSATPWLQVYVNFIATETNPGHSITNVKLRTTSGTLFEFDDRGQGWICYLDGIEYNDTAEIIFDTDPDTWQLFEIDLSQIDYFGWPYQSRQLGSTPITSIQFSAYGNTTGSINMLVDNIQLVPEPATIAIFGLGGLLTLSKRK